MLTEFRGLGKGDGSDGKRCDHDWWLMVPQAAASFLPLAYLAKIWMDFSVRRSAFPFILDAQNLGGQLAQLRAQMHPRRTPAKSGRAKPGLHNQLSGGLRGANWVLFSADLFRVDLAARASRARSCTSTGQSAFSAIFKSVAVGRGRSFLPQAHPHSAAAPRSPTAPSISRCWCPATIEIRPRIIERRHAPAFCSKAENPGQASYLEQRLQIPPAPLQRTRSHVEAWASCTQHPFSAPLFPPARGVLCWCIFLPKGAAGRRPPRAVGPLISGGPNPRRGTK